ncbi:DUF1223 domain-containing protein [Aestuariispira insulae]|uniref:Secreted protein n=1 Tax=Aestuariispira insulae TaxID=1461337 RepID=A0A3D9HE38_9PROT|nr:DUF1223 domain-containing protein [Aestuariispira insulae]RED47734.1 hypothetical protein DFP90_10998 [Aestuariispira insulae]
MKKRISALIATTFIFISASVQADQKRAVVVELFTSQGCSSCPPAEAFLQELAMRDDVIALEYHVDYWDYIGWQDPFADPAFTERQRAYVRNLGDRYVYTPQMVIDGARHVVGSRRHEVEQVIRQMRDERSATLPDIRFRENNGEIHLAISGLPQLKGEYVLTLVGFDGLHETTVKRGENSGKQLKNARVVRSLQRIGLWRGEAVTHFASRDEMAGDGGCALIIQERGTGRVLTGALINFAAGQAS